MRAEAHQIRTFDFYLNNVPFCSSILILTALKILFFLFAHTGFPSVCSQLQFLRNSELNHLLHRYQVQILLMANIVNANIFFVVIAWGGWGFSSKRSCSYVTDPLPAQKHFLDAIYILLKNIYRSLCWKIINEPRY